MATVAFNPLALARRLKDAGMDESQAEAVADGLHEAVTENVATKADLAAVEKTLRAEMGAVKWMVGLTLALVLAVLARSFALI